MIIKPTKSWEEYILPLTHHIPIGTCTLKWNWNHLGVEKVKKRRLVMKALKCSMSSFIAIPFYNFDMFITVLPFLIFFNG